MADADTALKFAHKGNLTEGPIKNHLLRLTIPMIWGIFAVISFQLVDTFYISMLGSEPLAAVTFTFPVTFTFFSIIMGFSIAMSSVVSRQIGEGNHDKVRRITTHGLILTFIVGLVMAGLGLLFMQPLFRMMGATELMMPMIIDYMMIWFIGSILINLPMVGNSAIRAGGDTLVPAMIMTVAVIVNVVLDPIMIFGLFGFPRMELQGAALATVIANSAAMFAGLYVLYFKKKMICRDGLHLNHFKDSLKRLGFIALPVALTGVIQPVTNAVIIALLATYSHEAVAAYGVATRLEAFAFSIIMAIAAGMSPIIGQNFGAKNYQRVNNTLNLAFKFAVTWSLFVGAVFIFFAEPIAKLFAESDSPELIAVIVIYFHVVALTYAPGNLVQGWGSAFNAMGMPKRSLVMIVVRLLILQIPLAVIGHHAFGINGIFAAIAITNMVTGLGFHMYNRKLCRQYT